MIKSSKTMKIIISFIDSIIAELKDDENFEEIIDFEYREKLTPFEKAYYDIEVCEYFLDAPVSEGNKRKIAKAIVESKQDNSYECVKQFH